jgi:hypothetical protein
MAPSVWAAKMCEADIAYCNWIDYRDSGQVSAGA